MLTKEERKSERDVTFNFFRKGEVERPDTGEFKIEGVM